MEPNQHLVRVLSLCLSVPLSFSLSLARARAHSCLFLSLVLSDILPSTSWPNGITLKAIKRPLKERGPTLKATKGPSEP